MGAPLEILQANAFRKGFDPRRNLIPPNNTGKTYRTSNDIYREFLERAGGTVDGKPATRFEAMLYLAIKDALNGELPPTERIRVIEGILNRLEGKPVETQNLNVSGRMIPTGKRIEDITDVEELNRIIAEPQRFRELPTGEIVEASFEDLTPQEPGEQNSNRPETDNL